MHPSGGSPPRTHPCRSHRRSSRTTSPTPSASPPASARLWLDHCWRTDGSMSDIGVIVNPWAGKDIRRLHSPTGHTPDTTKVAIVRQVVVAAVASGADHVHLAQDAGRIADRAIAGLPASVRHCVRPMEGAGTGSAPDNTPASSQLRELGWAGGGGVG